MKKFLTKYRKLLIFILLIIIFGVSFVLQKHYKNIVCTKIIVNIHNKNVRLIDSSYVIRVVNYYSKNGIVGKKFTDINMNDLEEKLSKNPFIEKAEIYRGNKSYLVIDIWQKRPIMRFFFTNSVNFYVDNQGNIIPSSGKHPQNVPVITYDTVLDTKKLKKVLNLADLNIKFADSIYNFVKILQNDPELKDLIDQIDYKNGVITLIPKISDVRIFFDDKRFDDKIYKLKAVFKHILPTKGWDKYSAINLNYKNQIVCIKK